MTTPVIVLEATCICVYVCVCGGGVVGERGVVCVDCVHVDMVSETTCGWTSVVTNVHINILGINCTHTILMQE